MMKNVVRAHHALRKEFIILKKIVVLLEFEPAHNWAEARSLIKGLQSYFTGPAFVSQLDREADMLSKSIVSLLPDDRESFQTYALEHDALKNLATLMLNSIEPWLQASPGQMPEPSDFLRFVALADELLIHLDQRVRFIEEKILQPLLANEGTAAA